MGNMCQSQYRNANYSAIKDDGAPYYRPRNHDPVTQQPSATSPSYLFGDDSGYLNVPAGCPAYGAEAVVKISVET
jgi:hypothetical protein